MSLRIRLVAGYTAAMLVVLAAAGTFVYLRVQTALDRELNTELTDTSSRLATQLSATGKLRSQSPLISGEYYQVLDARGHVVSRSPSGSTGPLIDAATAREALTQPVRLDVGELLPSDDRALRIYATALTSRGPGTAPASRSRGSAAVLVVAAERKQRDEALRELLAQLLLAGLATALVTAFVGDRLARASLRPVERYRRQAADVAGGATGIRLDVPRGRDDEITRLGHTLNDMLQALEEAVEHERRFVNDASHELRTPLTLIGTRVQLARRRKRTVDQHEVVLEEVEADIRRLSGLADQLLEMGTIGNGTRSGNVSAEPVDVAVVVRAEVERRRALAMPNSTYAQPDALRAVTSGAAPVALHRARADQLLSNLMDNAALHGAPPVTLTVDSVPETVRLRVADSGAGMDAETLAGAHMRFARAPAARNRPGAGLGLALVHAIVLDAGGELRLCFGGRHERLGHRRPVDCDHGPEMTITVLLPSA